MSYSVVIVESPNKVKNVKSYLDALYPQTEWKVSASVGHFTELSKESGEGYVTAGVRERTYQLDSVVSPSKKGVFQGLKALTKDAEKVYLATDDDREGEAIADSLRVFLGLRSPVRVLFKEITKRGVQVAMDNPAPGINSNLVVSQRARRVLDRLVGFLVSPELYRLMGVSGVSAGRVQSPVLRLIYERAHEIAVFNPKSYFDVVLRCESEGKEFKAKLRSKQFHNEEGYFTDREKAEAIAKISDLELSTFEETENLKNPPSALTTSLMQQVASGVFKIKPKDAMKAAQSLYEAGLITYHRTDNPNISSETYNYILENMSELGVVSEQRMFHSAEGAQEGHPAITPTDFSNVDAGTTETERNIYSIIRTRAIASQLLPAKYRSRSAVLVSEKNFTGEVIEFSAAGSECIDYGYLTFVKGVKDDDDEESTENLPDLNKGFNVLGGDCLDKKTRPPKIYTIKTLLAKLSGLGIGRPATLDSIFETLEQKQYVVIDQKNQLTPTTLGQDILQRLVGQFDFTDYDFTSKMENNLDLIANGNLEYIDTVDSFYLELKKQINVLRGQETSFKVHSCSWCGSDLINIKKPGKYDFFACTNDSCKFTADNVNGEPDKKEKPVLSNHKCPKCGLALIHRYKENSHDFWGCSGFPKCDYSADNKNGVPVDKPKPEHECPKCGKPLAQRIRKSDKSKFWGCTGYRNGCKASFNTAEDGSPVLR